MKKKSKITNLIYNDKFVLVLAVIVAVTIWLVVAVEKTPEVSVTVPNVKVTIDDSYKVLGLECYEGMDTVVNVNIVGPKYVVDSKENWDKITVTADVAGVKGAGKATLPLTARISDGRAVFSIVSISQDTISAFFDSADEKDVQIEVDNLIEDGITADGYYAGDVSADNTVIHISGPKTEVNKVEKAVAFIKPQNLNSSFSEKCEIKLIGFGGSQLEDGHITKSAETVNVKIPVYKKQTMACSIEFSNKPAAFFDGFSYAVEPSAAVFGVFPDEETESANKFTVGTIDFSSLKPGENIFSFKAEDVTNGVVLDGTEEFVVTVEVSGVSEKEIDPPGIVCTNVPAGLKVDSVKPDFTKLIVIGAEDAAEEVNPADLSVTADLSSVDIDSPGTVTVPLTITSEKYWVYGEYTATVTLT